MASRGSSPIHITSTSQHYPTGACVNLAVVVLNFQLKAGDISICNCDRKPFPLVHYVYSLCVLVHTAISHEFTTCLRSRRVVTVPEKQGLPGYRQFLTHTRWREHRKGWNIRYILLQPRAYDSRFKCALGDALRLSPRCHHRVATTHYCRCLFLGAHSQI